LQAQHIEQLATLGEVGLLDTETFRQRFYAGDRTGQGCRRRLRLYAEHGLTQRIRLSLATTQRTGQLPTLHRLTVYGANVLELETGMRPLRYARTEPPRQTHTLLHRLGIAKIQLAFNDACEAVGLTKPIWILEYDPTPNASLNGRMSERFRLCHQFPTANGQTTTCWPDAACHLTLHQRGRPWHLALLFEYDRSTETHAQLNGSKPGHVGNGKLDGYAALLRNEAYREYFSDVQGARVMFIVRSEERLRNSIATFRNHPAAAVTRFAVEQELSAPLSASSSSRCCNVSSVMICNKEDRKT